MGGIPHYFIVLLGLFASISANVIKGGEYSNVVNLLDLDLHLALETPSSANYWDFIDDDIEDDYPLSEEELLDLIELLRGPNSGSTLYIEKFERAFDIHSNETGTLKTNNVTGNYTSKSYRDVHTDTDSHTGHYNSVMYKEGQMPNSSLHLVLQITEGRIKGMGYTTEWMERGWTHVFQKNKDNSMTQIANTTQGSYGQINSTADGQFVFATLYMGANNMSNHFINWANKRHGSLNRGSGGFNWTATGEGKMKAVNGTTKLGADLLVDLLMNKQNSQVVNLVESGGTANFTDASAGELQLAAGVSPYNNTYSEILVVSSNETYNSTEKASGFMWRTQNLLNSKEEYSMHLIDLINILM